MKASDTCEAQAMKLSAKKIRLNQVKGGPLNEIADDLDKAADDFLAISEIPTRGAGGELVSSRGNESIAICPKREKIDRVNVDASLDRLDLAQKNGVLNMALDTAEAIGATSSVEQMLAHQLAIVHRMALDLMALAGNTRDPIEKCRLINTASKLMDTYQKGLLTLNKIRSGGQQIVTVQHVHITEGGQAVINGAVDARGADKK